MTTPVETIAPADGALITYQLNMKVIGADDLEIPYDQRHGTFGVTGIRLEWECSEGTPWQLTQVVVVGQQRLKDGTLGTVDKSAVFHSGLAPDRHVHDDAPIWVREAVAENWPR